MGVCHSKKNKLDQPISTNKMIQSKTKEVVKFKRSTLRASYCENSKIKSKLLISGYIREFEKQKMIQNIIPTSIVALIHFIYYIPEGWYVYTTK